MTPLMTYVQHQITLAFPSVRHTLITPLSLDACLSLQRGYKNPPRP